MASDVSRLPGAAKDYNIITNDVILDSLRTEEDKREWSLEDFSSIRTLTLSYRMICLISNLSDFRSLTRLNLSNNAIEKISGLDNLINLESLDLSFNKLTTIEGIGHLHRLTDLALNNNKLSSIDGLAELNVTIRDLTGIPENYHKIQLINLSSNNINNLHATILLLRDFKDLRVLSLENNPLVKQTNYRLHVIAYLKNLRYFDHKVIREGDRTSAHEVFKMDLISLEEKDAVETQARTKALQKARQIRIDCAADALGLATFVDREFLETPVTERICVIPAVKLECYGKFRLTTSAILKDLARLMRRRRILKLGELAEFEEAYGVLSEQGRFNLQQAMQAYIYQRDDYLDLCDGQIAKNPKNSVHYATEARNAVQELLPPLRVKLLKIESSTTADIIEIVDQIIANLTSLVNKTSEQAQSAFTKVRENVLQLHESCLSLLNKAMELKLAREAGLAGNDMSRQVDLGSGNIADGGDTAQGSATGLGGVFFNTTNLADMQNLLPTEITPEVNALLKDKGSVIGAAVAAHESRMSAVDQREDSLIASQKEFLSNTTRILHAGEAARSRQHVLDINEFIQLEEQWIIKWYNDKISIKK